MMRRRPNALAALVALGAVAAALAGCQPTASNDSNSAADFRGDQRLVAQAVEDLQAAADDGDEAKICRELLARPLVDRLTRAGRSCTAAVDNAIRDSDTRDMTVEAVRTTSGRATARVRLETGDTDRRATMQLVREGARWKVADLQAGTGVR